MKSKHILSRDKCPVCNSDFLKSIFKRNFNEDIIRKYMNVAYQGNADISFLNDIDFEILKCKKCNLAFQKNVLNEEKLNELYNKWIDPKLAEEWNKQKLEEKTIIYLQILTFANNYLKKYRSNIKVLDYGAGYGDSLILAKKMGFDSYALEYSTERISYMKERGVSVIGQNSNKLFDFIIVNQILEHVTYPNGILKDIHSRLNDNGIAYLSVPNCPSIEKRLLKTDNIVDENEFHRVLLDASVGAFQHINFFTNSSFKTLVKKTDFEVITPYVQAFSNPKSIKSFIRPFYRYYFGTSFFVKKK